MTEPVVCCDLDGVVWRGETPITGSAAAVASLHQHGVRVSFLTNNSSQRVVEYVEKLRGCGIDCEPDDIATSAQAAALLATEILPRGAKVLACAGPGVVEALTDVDFEVVDDPKQAVAVVVGFHRDFDFERLTRASDALRAGAVYIATNEDATYPVPGGFVPGAGAIVAAVSTASGRAPEVAGKPYPPTVQLVHERFGAHGVMVGDRPSTDGALADALGWPFALVLSGVAGSKGGEPIPDPPPPFVARDLAHLVPDLVHAIRS
jgi:4-nitrophenyl phosphatase